MKKLLFVFSLLLPFVSVAQDTKSKPQWKRDTLIGTNRFAIYNNWLSFGGGIAVNTSQNKTQVAAVLNYNFHIQKVYFQAGVMLSGGAVGSYTTKQAHLCYGRRKETSHMNFSYFGGVSVSAVYNETSFIYDASPGIYAEVEYIRKVTYDVGLGPSLFVDAGVKQTIAGVKLDLYFSGAYKGSTKKKRPQQGR